MALGNEASAEPRDEAATAAVADPAQWTPNGGGIIVQAELPKGSMKSVRCRFGEARPGKRLVSHLRPGGPQ